jgi:uncharacterized integral membrane protein
VSDDESGSSRPDPGAPPPTAPGAPSGIPEPETRVEQQHLRALQRERQARVAKAIVALLILMLLIIFIISNAQHVPVDFVFFTRHPRLIWVMFACTVLGGVVGYIIGRPGKQVRIRRTKDEAGGGR